MIYKQFSSWGPKKCPHMNIAIFVDPLCPHYVGFTRPPTHIFRSLYPPYFAMCKFLWHQKPCTFTLQISAHVKN